ncbi:MAG: cytochrome P450, partial [Myxococcota bacterium]
RAVGPSTDSTSARPTAETLDQLTLTARVFQESLRLYPPIWTIARQATEDDELGGLRIKAGTIVLISPFVIHRHPELWPDPERFDPDRFLPHAVETRDRLAWMPFGAGPRVCVGGGFALQEARIITAMVSRRFRLRSLPQAAPPEPEPLITLKPKGGLKMLIEPVSS